MLGLFVTAPTWAEVTFNWATIGNPGNAPDTDGYGSVSYAYQISKDDVTCSEYARKFLNAVDPAGANSLGLFALTGLGEDGVALNSVAPLGNKYSVVPGHANQPIIDVSWNSAARFVNWLSNGQGGGGTESGVYDMGLAQPTRAASATSIHPHAE